jgi:acyl carrier protein
LDDVVARLGQCFTAVFPQLSVDQMAQASVSTVKEWDSLNLATLIAVIEEEFGITFDAADFERLDSYSSILQVVQRETARS